MTGADLNQWWRRFRALPPDDPARIFAFALAVAALSALVVICTALILRPAQEINLEAERRHEIERILAETPGLALALKEADFTTLETRIVDLRLDDFARGVDGSSFDAEAAAADPNLYSFIEEIDDFAGISRRPDLLPVYLARKHNRLAVLVLPAYGTGYQSTIRAYVALAGDLNSIYSLTIYDQGEMPQGAGITDPRWLESWQGKKIRDEVGNVRLDVVPGGGASLYEVDSIAGAERSAEGVANLVRFWLGENGFGPFLDRLREE